jgi:hypothetical protein
MFGIFKSDAPRYQGQGQPTGYGEGVLGALVRVIAGPKPAYRGAGQPAAAPGLLGWFSGSPSYRTATPEAAAGTDSATLAAGKEPVREPEAPAAETETDAEPDETAEAPCEPDDHGDGESALTLEHSEPLFARVPVTIVIRGGTA